jgi:single-strand DNA-binding protein
MSKGYTNAVIMGGLGRDPEIRATQSGKRIASLSLAVEEGFGDKAQTVWYGIVVFGELVDFVEKYLKKGKTVIVSGRLQTSSWDDKATGVKKSKVEIIAKDITFGDDGGKGGSGQPARAAATPPARRETAAPERREAVASDDPFGEDEPF